MDINKEANNLATHINTKVKRGFRASVLRDNAVKVEFSDSESSFDLILVADTAYSVFVPDFCPVGMTNRPQNMVHRERLGFLFLTVSEWNVKMYKRLTKDK